MAATKKIGILTGGGDVPGLNPVIKSVVYGASQIGRTVIGIRQGWEGLTHLIPGANDDLTSANSRATTRAPSTAPAAPCCTPRAPTRAKCPKPSCPRIFRPRSN